MYLINNKESDDKESRAEPKEDREELRDLLLIGDVIGNSNLERIVWVVGDKVSRGIDGLHDGHCSN